VFWDVVLHLQRISNQTKTCYWFCHWTLKTYNSNNITESITTYSFPGARIQRWMALWTLIWLYLLFNQYYFISLTHQFTVFKDHWLYFSMQTHEVSPTVFLKLHKPHTWQIMFRSMDIFWQFPLVYLIWEDILKGETVHQYGHRFKFSW